MRTWDLENDEGKLIGFEIRNLLISRTGVARTLKNIPGVSLTKLPKPWAWSDDDFIHFVLDGHKFLVIEPFGDNSRYWIVADSPDGTPCIPKIRHAFAHRGVFGAFGGK